MKPRFFIYSLLLTSSFSISSCNSNEDLSGAGNVLTGCEVSFSAETGLAKKISYGTGTGTSIPVYWSANDLIANYSPKSTIKQAVYKANAGGSSRTLFSLNTGSTALTWGSKGNAQSFCSFFPSTAAAFSGAEGAVIATATLPSSQDGTSVNNFMAGFQYTNTDPVKLNFAPLMNVLRLNIVDDSLNVDADHTVSSIVIKSKEATLKKVSGIFKIGYPSSSVTNLSAGSFTSDLSSATGDSIVISGSALTSVTNNTLNVTAYLLPQDYKSLKVTVYTNHNNRYVAKAAFSSTTFAKSSVCDLTFGSLDEIEATFVAPSNTIDLGCPEGGYGHDHLYLAISNLWVEKTETGTMGYIPGYPWYMAPISSYNTNAVYTKRDLFCWGEITGWKTNWSVSNPPANISGDASYDIAAALLHNRKWRLPTRAEFLWLKRYCSVVWTDDYQGTGVAGCIMKGSSNTSATYDGKDHSDKTAFFPATGSCSLSNNGDGIIYADDRGIACMGWTGTHGTYGACAWYLEKTGGFSVNDPIAGFIGMSVRPVTK